MLQTTRWATAAIVVSIGLRGIAAAATLDVPGDFATIQACIDAAVSGVDECVVAPGTYHETINFLGKAITLRSSGGADVTTIDAAGIGGSVVTCASGEGSETVLDGFTITGGTGTILDPGNSRGGGMYNDHSRPTVTNCSFSGNTANYGGGTYNESSDPTMTNCTFTENTAIAFYGGRGGGMSNSYSDPNVTDCTFRGNTALEGGGMYNAGRSPTVTNCTFTGNTATHSGGGMYNYSGSSPTVTYCTFGGNNAGAYGGGIFNSTSSPTVSESAFSGNTATYHGGGMFNYFNSSPVVVRCPFLGNRANVGGGMYNSDGSSPNVGNCTFIGNWALEGSGIYNTGSSPTATNCTFTRNTSTQGGGAGMHNVNLSNPTVVTCVLWDNGFLEFMDVTQSTSTFRFSDVQGFPFDPKGGNYNVDLNPMFVRPPDPGPDGAWDGVDDDYGDLRLQAGSPCINAGDPGFVAQPGETDLEGHARVLCGRVDMGAYEFGIGDYDCNQVVDLADFSSWQACMTGPRDVRELALAALTGPAVQSAIDTCPEPRRNRQLAIGCEVFDFNADGDVDLLDFDAFQMIFAP